MNQQGGISAVVHHQLRPVAVRPCQRLFGAPPVFFQGFAFPGENRYPGFGHGGGRMILGGKNIAGSPANLGPSATSVSISTAVCTVMCRLPLMRAPSSGFCAAYFSRVAINPGISFSAISISLRPKSARVISLTL